VAADGPLDLVDEGMQRRIGVMRRTLIAEHGLCARCLPQLPYDPALANPRLTAQQDDLALAVARLLPASQEQRDFLVPPDQRSEAGPGPSLEAARGRAHSGHPPDPDRPIEAFQGLPPQVVAGEHPAQQALRMGADQDRTRLRERLQASGAIGRVAHHRLLLSSTFADEIADHHQAGVDSDPAREGLPERRGQLPDRVDQLEPRAHGALGVVLVRPRIAEVSEHAIAHELGDVAVEAAHVRRSIMFLDTS
jgi:hypothetical protein